VCLWAAACSGPGFAGTSDQTSNLTINMSGFAPYIGDTLYLKVADQAPLTNDSAAVVIAPLTITRSNFEVVAVNALRNGRSYNIDFWVDRNGNGFLDTDSTGTGADRSWRVETTGTTVPMEISIAADSDFTDIRPF
jgi:uncharacterized protein (DUF2141 family)